MTNSIVQKISSFAELLLLPTVLLLLVLLALVIVMLGGLVREFIERSLRLRDWSRVVREAKHGKFKNETIQTIKAIGLPNRFVSFLSVTVPNQKTSEKFLEDLVIFSGRKLLLLSFMTRVGPMLGLIGTLIPLGPALGKISAGSFDALASDLMVAFTTTIMGILVGGFAYGMMLVRKSFYEQDLSDIEFLLGLINTEVKDGKSDRGSSHVLNEDSQIDSCAEVVA